tara:strand:+ start:972 stop:2267 length:1296 start_codon:yes stop_codon:yes gene_type:complete
LEINIKKKINKITDFGSICFDLGLFLLPSAFLISGILLLFASIIGFINQEGFFKDGLNKLLFTGSLFIVISSLINTPKLFEFKLQNFNLGFLNWVPLSIVFYGFQYYLDSYTLRRKCCLLLLAGSVPVIISVAGQTLFNWHSPIQTLNGLIVWYQSPIKDFNAVSGLFNNPNYLGSWLNIIWPFGFAYLLSQYRIKFKMFIISIFLASLASSILLSASRAAWLCLFLSIILFFIRLTKKWFIIYFIGIISLYLLTSNSFIFESINHFLYKNLQVELLDNFSKETYINDISRIDIWGIGINNIFERPIWGHGASSFPKYIYEITGAWKGHAHNLPIELIYSYGLPAGILILVPFFSVLFIAARNIFLMKRYKMYDYIFDKAIIISLLLLAFYHLFDMTYFDGRISITGWIMFAAIKNILRETNDRFILKEND